MGASITDEGSVKVVRLAGMLRKAELDSIQYGEAAKLAPDARVNVLILAEEFEGWQKGDHWGDLRFVARYGDRIEKLAIVADPKWEDQLLMFTGAGFRKTKVKFFAPVEIEEARKWLAE